MMLNYLPPPMHSLPLRLRLPLLPHLMPLLPPLPLLRLLLLLLLRPPPPLLLLVALKKWHRLVLNTELQILNLPILEMLHY
jgi:hypothetical protein